MSDKKVLMDMLDQVNIDNVWDIASYVCDHFPGRLPGTKDAKDYADYVIDYYKKAGLSDVTLYKAMGLLKNPGPNDVRLTIDGKEEKLVCNANAQCGDTPIGGFSGELVYVGPGGEDDYECVDAKGKVILTELSYGQEESSERDSESEVANCILPSNL